ncbi:hypothetical protein PG996_003699 [Apiospora saccharicola]|uniref:Uncharacterized protein n=1 Tax=Apiospora saccharicola TaxID=335842 RepID=A0ABR1W217_9PEZI
MGRPEEAESASAGNEEAPPPPYTEGKGSEASPRPSSAISAAASHLQPTTTTAPYHPFPAAFNLYHQKSKSGRSLVYDLGERDSEPLYTLTIHSGISGNPSLVLHNGPDPGAPALASADKEPGQEPKSFSHKFTGKASLITLPALPNFGRPTTEEPLENHVTLSGAGYAFSLEVQRGALNAITGADDGIAAAAAADGRTEQDKREDDEAANQWTRERFEWRKSRGNEVKQLDKINSGWKLVRIHSEADGVGGTRRARDAGASSDGKEVVAVFAEVSGWSTSSEVVKFRFLGSGATGEMGPRWSLMAVVTALRVWDLQNGLSESAAATAGGAAGHGGGSHSRSTSKAGGTSPTYGAPGGAAVGGSEKFA